MDQTSLFGSGDDAPTEKPSHDMARRLQLLITVKAAPNPSERYGETVCVAGLSADLNSSGWIRLYPINFRELERNITFRKYDIVSVDAVPARQDSRNESWRPITSTLTQESHLDPWKKRTEWLSAYIETSMCQLNASARISASAKSLALIRPRKVTDLRIERHPGWTAEEEKKITNYVSQLDLLSEDRAPKTPLEAPRFRGTYHYLCGEPTCRGHKQGVLDWEFVALQRTLSYLDDESLVRELRTKFLDMMCSPDKDTAFYVGNQAKRAHVFSVLGVYYPKKA